MRHKFNVGQMVDFAPRQSAMFGAHQQYEIVTSSRPWAVPVPHQMQMPEL